VGPAVTGEAQSLRPCDIRQEDRTAASGGDVSIVQEIRAAGVNVHRRKTCFRIFGVEGELCVCVRVTKRGDRIEG
jgi:hypothetical protein